MLWRTAYFRLTKGPLFKDLKAFAALRAKQDKELVELFRRLTGIPPTLAVEVAWDMDVFVAGDDRQFLGFRFGAELDTALYSMVVKTPWEGLYDVQAKRTLNADGQVAAERMDLIRYGLPERGRALWEIWHAHGFRKPAMFVSHLTEIDCHPIDPRAFILAVPWRPDARHLDGTPAPRPWVPPEGVELAVPFAEAVIDNARLRAEKGVSP